MEYNTSLSVEKITSKQCKGKRKKKERSRKINQEEFHVGQEEMM